MKITKRIMKVLDKKEVKKNKIPKDFPSEKIRKHAKKKTKKVYKFSFEICPFCENKLSLANKKEPWEIYKYETWCRKCGASWVPQCPACKNPTWMSKDGRFKHQILGCGFEGKLKIK